MLFSAVMFREAILLGVSHETAYHNVHFTANRSFPFATVEQTVSIKNRIYSLVCIVCCLNVYHAEYKIAVSPLPFSQLFCPLYRPIFSIDNPYIHTFFDPKVAVNRKLQKFICTLFNLVAHMESYVCEVFSFCIVE